MLSRRIFQVDGDFEDNYFDLGRLKITSGLNQNLHLDIAQFVNNQIVLMIPATNKIQIGDSLTAVAGCIGTKFACMIKFQNYANFFGEPDVPTTDLAINTPTT